MTTKWTDKPKNLSDVAAHSLQAGMSLKRLQEFAKTIGVPINRDELSQIREVRRNLRNQKSRAVGF